MDVTLISNLSSTLENKKKHSHISKIKGSSRATTKTSFIDGTLLLLNTRKF